MKLRTPRVVVVYQDRSWWTVHVEGLNGLGDWCSIILGRFPTRAIAAAHARPIRAAVRSI